MICDAPPQPLSPPLWHVADSGVGADQLALGFVTFGTGEQVARVAAAAAQAGFRCGLPGAQDGKTEIMVMFDSTKSRDASMRFYQRVSSGEFGTSGTGLMLLPAGMAKK